MSTDSNPDFEALLDYLKRTRGFDFTAYKRPSLMRRIEKRMQLLNIQSYGDYLDYLEVHPDEFPQLFNSILINVTAFFRDPPVWEYLAAEILPRILHGKRPEEPLRVWSAGCASGEEAFSLAMLLAEAVGSETFRARVKIYASNVDEAALNHARLASYSAREVEGIPPALLGKYFEQLGDRFVFHKDLRRAVIFGRHDLIQDAPISRIDLLACRNTLMYFNAEVQARILARFHFALNDGGFLFLGKAEMLLGHTNTFTPVDLKRRIFEKVARSNPRDRLLVMAQGGREEVPPPNHLINHVRIREAAFNIDPVAQVVIDLTGNLVLANDSGRALFGITSRDLGRPLQGLEMSYRPVELRSYIERAYAERHPLLLREVGWPASSGDNRYFDIQFIPLLDPSGSPLGIKVLFGDVTRLKQYADENQQVKQELETSREELQTTSEELQSTIEELETTNEELQSTNEELETMNEELQSTNEELRTMNDEIQRRGDELNQVNFFLESILTSLRTGVVVMDRDLRILIWNHEVEELWGLRGEEVRTRHFFNLDIGLPLEPLRQPIKACLNGNTAQHETLVDATNRRGKPICCRITFAPLRAPGDEVRGVILIMEKVEDAKPPVEASAGLVQ